MIVWLSVIPKRFCWISLLSLPVDVVLFYYFILCFLLFDHSLFPIWCYTLLILTRPSPAYYCFVYTLSRLLSFFSFWLCYSSFSFTNSIIPLLLLFLLLLFQYRLALGLPLLLWSTSFLLAIINCWIYVHPAFLILSKFNGGSLDKLSLLDCKLTNLARPFLYQELHYKRHLFNFKASLYSFSLLGLLFGFLSSRRQFTATLIASLSSYLVILVRPVIRFFNHYLQRKLFTGTVNVDVLFWFASTTTID